MTRWTGACLLAAILLAVPPGCNHGDSEPEIRIGAKAFTESVVLAEILARLVEGAGHVAQTRELGGTTVVWNALLAGEIDCYVDYTGTLRQEILEQDALGSDAELVHALRQRGIRMSAPLGFNNTYALGISPRFAETHPDVDAISDLRGIPGVRYGFGHEFLDRKDGWPSLSASYGLPQENARGLDHDLAYRGLVAGSIDVMDVYTTDADVRFYGIKLLKDDLGFFPEYDAVILWRDDLKERYPGVTEAMLQLEGAIDDDQMRLLNARCKIDGVPEPLVARNFVRQEFGQVSDVSLESRHARLVRYTWEHLRLVGVSTFFAIVFAVPLGIVAAKTRRLGQGLLAVVGVIQTIPSLVLFVLLIPVLGIGPGPAIAALFLYSLLPIVRNTHAGLTTIPGPIRESALALGLPPVARLRLIELPLAMPAILAGIKTAVVINIGTATLGGLISAGGYGDPIFTGFRKDDMSLLLEGAIPAALMALSAQGIFELIDRRLSSGTRAGTVPPAG